MQSGFWRQVEGFTTFRAFREHVTLYVARSQGPLELTRQQLVEIVDGRVTNWADVGGPAARIHLCRLRPRSPRPKQYIAALDRKLDLALRGIGTSLKGARPMIEVESYAALAAARSAESGSVRSRVSW